MTCLFLSRKFLLPFQLAKSLITSLLNRSIKWLIIKLHPLRGGSARDMVFGARIVGVFGSALDAALFDQFPKVVPDGDCRHAQLFRNASGCQRPTLLHE